MARKAKKKDILEDIVIEDKKKEVKEVVEETPKEVVEVKKEDLRLVFNGSGWCNELNKSYRKGAYTCKTKKEFDILKKLELAVIVADL